MDKKDISELIALAWCDKTSFDAIAKGFGLREKEVIALMRQNLKPKSFQNWRARVTGRKAKHAKIYSENVRLSQILEDA